MAPSDMTEKLLSVSENLLTGKLKGQLIYERLN